MKTNKIIVGFVLVALVAVGAYFFPRMQPVNQAQLTQGTPGDTNSTARIAECSLDMSTTTPTLATTTGATGCLFNNSSQDRIITSIEVYAHSLGTMVNGTLGVQATTTLILSTSTGTQYPTSNNSVFSQSLATTSNGTTALTDLFIATSSPGIIGTGSTVTYGQPEINSFVRIWPAGTYISSYMNATSSAGSAVVVVKYVVAP